MISSASTLLLATLVFNAASVLGAPIRMATVEPVARAEITPVHPVARAPIVDVQDNRRRSLFGRVSRRSARLVSERDVPFSEFVEVREPAVEAVAPAVEARERRYPRRVLHDFYKRDPATSVKESLTFNKVTVHDTPADAAAFNFGDLDENQSDTKSHDQKPPCTTDAADAGAKVAPTVAVPAPTGLPTNVPNVSTTITVSTIIPDASAPAATAPAVVAPVVIATPAVADPTAPTAVPAANGGIPQAAPLPASGSGPAPVAPVVNAPADGSVPVVTGGNPSATVPTPATGADPAATSPAAAAAISPATTTGTSSPVPNNTTPAADGTTTPSANGSPAPGGDASTPISPATDAASAAASATADASTPAARRSVGRRTLAVSGASWASAVRRELSNN